MLLSVATITVAFTGSPTFVSLPLIAWYVLWPSVMPPYGIDYKSVTGPFKLIVLVPLLVVITFGVTFVMVVEILCLSSDSARLPLFILLLLFKLLLMALELLLLLLLLILLFILLLVVLFNRIASGPVVMVNTLFASNCDRVCNDFKRCSKLKKTKKKRKSPI